MYRAGPVRAEAGDVYKRQVYINAKAFVAVKNYLADRKDTNPYLFPREINTKERTMISNFSRKDWFKDPRLVTKADHFGGESVNNMVRTIGKRAGVKGVHTHRFRRTCATQALRHGMPVSYTHLDVYKRQRFLGAAWRPTTISTRW